MRLILRLLVSFFIFCHGFRQKQKFVRLPSGFTFPADAASNFQRDAYVPATFSPPSERILHAPPRYVSSDNEGTAGGPQHGMGYEEYKKAMSSKFEETPQIDTYKASPPPEVGGATIPPVTNVAAPSFPPPPPTAVTTTSAPVTEATTTAATVSLKKGDTEGVAQSLYTRYTGLSPEQQRTQKGQTYTSLGGSQFYQSILGGKGAFNPLSFFLNGGGGPGNNGFFVPVPIVIPPPPPPPPGPKCFTNPSGFLCCNVTLEKTMEEAYIEAKSGGISSCNVQKMATAVQEKAEKKFGTTFESVAAHKDFVAKINFAGDLNCKIEIDGKFIMAYATPLAEQEVNIVDANSFFSGKADQEIETANGTKPTYIVYGPIKK